MGKRERAIRLALFGAAALAFLVGAVLTAPPGSGKERIQEVMGDAVLHDIGQIRLFGALEVTAGLISAFTVTGLLVVFALGVRIFVIPRFQMRPGKFQLLLEQAVGLFRGLARSNSPYRNTFLGGYVFTAGSYIFVGTLFELLGLQAVTTQGRSIALPAPLSDINGAIALGFLSYGVIVSGGLAGSGLRGAGRALKDFSLPVSMSFRLFGALLSGALVTELVYHYIQLSFVLPVVVGVLFTLLHALIQAYVLTMLTALFYGEAAAPAPEKRPGKRGRKPKDSSALPAETT